METMHPMGSGFGGSFSGKQVSDFPSQSTVDVSGEITNPDASYDGGTESGAKNAATKGGLPHPEPRPFKEGDTELSFDPLDLLDAMTVLSTQMAKAFAKIEHAEDERIKRTMRGPIVVSEAWNTTDTSITLETNPVPQGEIWLIQKVLVWLAIPGIANVNTSSLYIFVDSNAPENFIGLSSGSLFDTITAPLTLRAGQKIVAFTSGAAETDGTTVYMRVEYVSVSADMKNSNARY